MLCSRAVFILFPPIRCLFAICSCDVVVGDGGSGGYGGGGGAAAVDAVDVPCSAHT